MIPTFMIGPVAFSDETHIEWKWLECSGFTGEISTTYGGVLNRLRLLSEYLSDRIGWYKSQAIFFVLTGEVPIVPPISITIKNSILGPSLTSGPSRIMLTVDPYVTPFDLAAAYRKHIARFGRHTGKQRRRRPQTEKHITLAIFSVNRPEDETWEDRRLAWNKLYGERGWGYVTNFRRDYMKAQERVLKGYRRVPTKRRSAKPGETK